MACAFKPAAQAATDTSRTAQTQNRTRHTFGARQMRNDLVHVTCGLQPPTRSPSLAVYSMDLGSGAAALPPALTVERRQRIATSRPFRVGHRMASEGLQREQVGGAVAVRGLDVKLRNARSGKITHRTPRRACSAAGAAAAGAVGAPGSAHLA